MTARTLFIVIAGAGVACGAAAARGQNSWRFVARDLSEQVGELTTLEGGVVSFIDEHGRSQRRPVADFVAVVHELAPPERTPRELPWITRQLDRFSPGVREDELVDSRAFVGRLGLTDGQVWVGTPLSATGQTITWFVEDALVLPVGLERIVSAEIYGPLDSMTRSDWKAVGDLVALRNGDVLDGFVDSIDEQLRVESGGEVITMPLERVSGVLLANPSEAPEGMVVRTTGGSIITVDDVQFSMTGEMTAVLDHEGDTSEITLPGHRVRSVLFAPNAVASLAKIEPAEVSSADALSRQLRLETEVDEGVGFDSISLRGPVTVRWSFARPASRFAATVTLPPAMWAWGDCEFVVSTDDGREVLRERLWAERPSVEINVPLAGLAGLRVEVVSGRGGSVQDRVVLTRPVVAW